MIPAIHKARAFSSSVQSRHAVASARNVFGPPTGGAAYYGNQAYRYQQVTEAYRHWSCIAIQAYMREIAGGDPPEIGQLIHPEQAQKRKGREKAFARQQAWAKKRWVKKALGIPEGHEFEPYAHDDPVCRVFQNPNGPDVAYDLWAYTVLFHMLCGYVVLWVRRNDFGIPIEIWPIPTQWIQQLRVDSDGQPEGWVVMNPWGRMTMFPFDECVVLQDHSPLSRWEGYAISIAIAEWLDTYESLVRSRLAQFKNGAVPNIHVALGETYSDPDEAFLARFYAKWFSRFQGENNAGLPLITGPDIEIKSIGQISPELFLQGDENISVHVLAAYGVPKTVVGINDSMTYGSVLAVQGQFPQDDQTECLTSAGWKKHTKLTMNSRIACYEPASGTIIYRKPQRIMRVNYDGEMCRWQNRYVDILATPDHRMYVRKGFGKNRQPWGVGRIGDLTASPTAEYKLKIAAIAACDEPAPVAIVGERQRSDRVHNPKGCSNNLAELSCSEIDPKTWMEFLGWFLSEGCITNRGNGDNVYVSQLADSPFFAQIEDCLWRTGFRWHRSPNPDCRSWSCSGRRNGLATYLKKSCYVQIDDLTPDHYQSHTKKIPDFVKSWPAEYLELLLRTIAAGDGNKKWQGDWNCIYTTSLQLADDVQEIAVKCGYRCRRIFCKGGPCIIGGVASQRRNSWKVYVNKDDEVTVKPKHRSKVHYKGVVWCVQVETGMFITRRNGLAHVTGNCHFRINPMLTYYGQVMTEKVIRRSGKAYEDGVLHWHDRVPNDPVQLNADIQTDVAVGSLVPNEVRTLRGRPTYEHGGDDPLVDAKALVNWGTGKVPAPDQALKLDQDIQEELATDDGQPHQPQDDPIAAALNSGSGSAGGFLAAEQWQPEEYRAKLAEASQKARQHGGKAKRLPRWAEAKVQLNGVH